jgi:hypothetical protein
MPKTASYPSEPRGRPPAGLPTGAMVAREQKAARETSMRIAHARQGLSNVCNGLNGLNCVLRIDIAFPIPQQDVAIHFDNKARSPPVRLPSTTRMSGRMAMDAISKGRAFGPGETFTRMSCRAPPPYEIQTTKGSPVYWGKDSPYQRTCPRRRDRGRALRRSELQCAP